MSAKKIINKGVGLFLLFFTFFAFSQSTLRVDYEVVMIPHLGNINVRSKASYIEEKIGLKIKLPTRFSSELRFDYFSKNQLVAPKDLLFGPVYSKELISYRNTQLLPQNISKTRQYKVSWSILNLEKESFWFSMLSYNSDHPSFTTKTTNYNSFSEIENMINGTSNRWIFLLNNDRKIGKWLSMKTKISSLFLSQDNIVNLAENTLKSNTLELSQMVSTRFKKFPFQWDVGYTYLNRKFSQSAFENFTKTEHYKIYLGTRAIINKKWNINILGEYLIQKIPNFISRNVLIKGSILYQKEKSNFSYQLTFNNLLNLKSFVYYSSFLSNFGYEETITTAISGNIMLGLKYHF